MTISYSHADLTGVDEDKLMVAYYNSDTGIWELQETVVDKVLKTVTVYLKHFSRYALVHA